ncbi:MAG: phosphoribosylanthranilate isomerase [Gammaproteobacteria bacterium]|nr:phosphoribosylanthranilate isomerase [Gammaproteobacteria bacterium]MCW9004475.1 phosphoribosylanthranilate isomerase [Gammaproteobacteria bacterium]
MDDSVNPRTRVKICGMTRPEDALTAARLGVDAIGLVFYEKSPRNVSLDQAQQICSVLPAFVTRVALFLDPDTLLVTQVLGTLDIDLIQFHGSESAEFCASFNRPYIKALGMSGQHDLTEQADIYRDACGLLLDSHVMGAAGGTGEAFDWKIIPESLRHSIILAGGLKPDNVAEAIRKVRPFAVDLSSGVEAEPGIKDSALMAQLINEVKRVDCEIG